MMRLLFLFFRLRLNTFFYLAKISLRIKNFVFFFHKYSNNVCIRFCYKVYFGNSSVNTESENKF